MCILAVRTEMNVQSIHETSVKHDAWVHPLGHLYTLGALYTPLELCVHPWCLHTPLEPYIHPWSPFYDWVHVHPGGADGNERSEHPRDFCQARCPVHPWSHSYTLGALHTPLKPLMYPWSPFYTRGALFHARAPFYNFERFIHSWSPLYTLGALYTPFEPF